MKSILDLQHALLRDDPDAVSDFFSEANRRTSNASMQAAADKFGFKVAFLDSWLVTTTGEIAHLMGYKSDSAVRNFRQKYNLMAFNCGTSSSMMTKLAEVFDLHRNDGRTLFCGWDTVLVAAMKGRTPEAEAIQAYLIECERLVRLLSDREVQGMRQQGLRELVFLQKAIRDIRKSPDDPLTQFYQERIETVLGIKLPRSGQRHLSLVRSSSAETQPS